MDTIMYASISCDIVTTVYFFLPVMATVFDLTVLWPLWPSLVLFVFSVYVGLRHFDDDNETYGTVIAH